MIGELVRGVFEIVFCLGPRGPDVERSTGRGWIDTAPTGHAGTRARHADRVKPLGAT